MRRSRALLPFLAFLVSFSEPQASDDAPLPVDPAITRDELAHHVGFLASEELRGREAGTPEAVRAARYLARSLQEAGLRPGGDDDGFLQAITIVRIEHRSAPRLLLTENSGNRVEAVYGADFNVIIRGEARSTPDLTIRRVSKASDLPDEVRPDEALLFRVGPKIRKEFLQKKGLGDGSGFGLEIQLMGTNVGQPKGPPKPTISTSLEVVDRCEKLLLRGDVRQDVLWKGVRSPHG